MNALLVATLLAVTPLPFPAPRLAPVTDRTKFDPGTVLGYDAAKAELRVQCAAGVVTFKAGPDVQVFDATGQPLGTAARLVPGQRIRVWYLVEGGALAQEISVEETPKPIAP
jgi:phage baseplate assembly protein gpV